MAVQVGLEIRPRLYTTWCVNPATVASLRKEA
jgi:hypothetical protein